VGGVGIGLLEATVVTVGGVDTYYDYDERCWKYRRLGGGRVDDRSQPETGDVQADSARGRSAKRIVIPCTAPRRIREGS
jgi:hypothetical protein